MSDEAAHLAAVVALLDAGNANPMTLDEIDAAPSLPSGYTEVTATYKVTLENHRLDAESDVEQYRVITRAVGKTYGNAQEMRKRAAAALRGKVVTVDAATSTPLVYEISNDPIAPDDGYWSGVSEFSYAI